MKKEIKDIINASITKSEKIRRLYDKGLEIAEIRKLMNIRHQFADNVIRNRDGEVRKSCENSKSSEFRVLFDKGLKVNEIAKQTNSNPTFVHQVIKKYKVSKEVKVTK